MLGPVSASMGDCDPHRCRTRHPGLLSLSHPSVGRCSEYQQKLGEWTGTLRDALPVSVVSQCWLVSGWGL